ncbi:hypothetical protein [Adhaeribacter aquaticus]|uniref:hypothetical protein n=1 Tax=Adhaeribacter aquaticus TaxID=299567 RepID=UPI00047AE534|nr:hypothetical protein [Adhaeribacter aquaticus]
MIKTKLIHEGEAFTLAVDLEASLLFLCFKSQPIGMEFKDAVLMTISVLELYKIKHLISDLRRLDYISPENQEFLIKDYPQIILETSVEKIARITNGAHEVRKPLLAETHNNLSAKPEKSLTIQFFTDPEAAFDWLTCPIVRESETAMV